MHASSASAALQVDVNKVWLSFSSIFLAFAFVFGNSLRNLYEAIIFLFVIHPFDVGDALFVNGDWCMVSVYRATYEVAISCFILPCNVWRPLVSMAMGA